MWKFSYLNLGYNVRPPDVGQQQLNPDSLLFPTYTSTTIGCFTSNSITPFPGLGVQGSPLNLNSEFISPLNSQVFNLASSSSRLNASTPAKRFLVYDHSGDQRSLIFSSVNNPFQTLNPTLPSSNASYAFASNSHSNNKHEEMHEDTEEIDALLYSDSEFSFDSEEASTGHSPLNMKEEEVMVSIPPKRRKLDPNHSSIDESLIDTASSAIASNFQEIPSDDDADMNYVDSGSNLDDESRDKQFQTIVKALRRIIPGGDAMDTAAVLDEAISYLKSLKPQANSLDATTASI
ncbi:transcription factor bHLH143 [Dendrobium catenatum]|uniref:transcription factor bHLH143 n=1 Tax=Dendrobium catenatum TaxID=906689 RepID=UPI0009F21DC8|nr:transcription factor bHLH143 [Dendrobium catenatum]XP_020685207.1 transcription factor bHLH143 [Dendrobium catenatum]